MVAGSETLLLTARMLGLWVHILLETWMFFQALR
jgi:hypothetical protein